MAIVNEVITKFSFSGSTGPLQKFNSTLAFSIKGLTAMVGATAGAVAGITALTIRTAAQIDPMIQLSRTTGVSVSAIQELGYAASVSGSSLSAVESTIQSLSQRIGEAATRGSEDFARLGISVRDSMGNVKNADQVLAEVQTRFRQLGLSRAEQISFAEKLGIDRSMIQLLNRTSGELDALFEKARRLGTVSKKDADALASLTDSYTTLKFGIQSVQNSLAVGLAPVIKKTSAGFIDFIANNKELIEVGIAKAVEIFKAFGETLKRLMPVFGPVIAALAVMAGLIFAINSPIILAGAAVAGLALVFDDLMVALEGGDSLIKSFVLNLTGIDITPGMQKIADFMEWMLKVVADIGVAIANWFEFGDTSGIAKIGGGVMEGLSTAGGFWKDLLFGGSGSGSTTINNNVTQNVKADISTTESGAAIVDTMQRQLSNAKEQLAVGGM